MRRRPTFAQARIIRQIAQHGGFVIVTNTLAGKSYSCADGAPLGRRDAEGVLSHLIANRDGYFDSDPQSWRVKKPGDR